MPHIGPLVLYILSAYLKLQWVLLMGLNSPAGLGILLFPGAGLPDVGVVNPGTYTINLEGSGGHKKHNIRPFPVRF